MATSSITGGTGVVGSASAPRGSSEKATVFFLALLKRGVEKLLFRHGDCKIITRFRPSSSLCPVSESDYVLDVRSQILRILTLRSVSRHRPPSAPTRTFSTALTLIFTTMLARQSLGRIANASVLGAAPAGARNMATLREIEMRLKSVRNIEKITKVRICTSQRNPNH